MTTRPPGAQTPSEAIKTPSQPHQNPMSKPTPHPYQHIHRIHPKTRPRPSTPHHNPIKTPCYTSDGIPNPFRGHQNPIKTPCHVWAWFAEPIPRPSKPHVTPGGGSGLGVPNPLRGHQNLIKPHHNLMKKSTQDAPPRHNWAAGGVPPPCRPVIARPTRAALTWGGGDLSCLLAMFLCNFHRSDASSERSGSSILGD